MKFISFLVFICLLIFTLSNLKKFGTIETRDGYIIFESKDFAEGEEMHFSVKALDYDYLYDYVDYYYINNDFTNIEIYSRNYHVANFKKSTYNTEGFQTYRTVYFTIKKQKSQFYSTSGDYLVIELPVSQGYWASITNTEEDEGKIEPWVIAVIVVIILVIIIGVIIWYICRRIRQKKALAEANAANYAARQNYQAQVIQAQVEQAQAYQTAQVIQDQVNQAQAYQTAQAIQAQVNQDQAYQVDQANQALAYQDQMNPAPSYQQQYNYPNSSPDYNNYNNDVGYSSKAAAV